MLLITIMIDLAQESEDLNPVLESLQHDAQLSKMSEESENAWSAATARR